MVTFHNLSNLKVVSEKQQVEEMEAREMEERKFATFMLKPARSAEDKILLESEVVAKINSEGKILLNYEVVDKINKLGEKVDNLSKKMDKILMLLDNPQRISSDFTGDDYRV